jgi:hypothetical protein
MHFFGYLPSVPRQKPTCTRGNIGPSTVAVVKVMANVVCMGEHSIVVITGHVEG